MRVNILSCLSLICLAGCTTGPGRLADAGHVKRDVAACVGRWCGAGGSGDASVDGRGYPVSAPNRCGKLAAECGADMCCSLLVPKICGGDAIAISMGYKNGQPDYDLKCAVVSGQSHKYVIVDIEPFCPANAVPYDKNQCLLSEFAK